MNHLLFKPAKYYPGKDARVEYYYRDGDQLVRKRIRVNHIANLREQKRYAQFLSNQINEKLYAGWSPLLESHPNDSLRKAVQFYVGNFLPEREDSIRTYKSMVSIFMEWAKLRDYDIQRCDRFTKKQALEFLGHVNTAKKLSPRTYNNYITVMRTMFNKIVEHQFCKENPFADISKKKVRGKNRGIIPTSTLTEIRLYMQRECPEMLLPMKLLFYCGIRPTEICRLKVSNLMLDRGLIYIEADQAKDHESAPITLPYHLIRDLEEYAANLPKNAFLFSADRLRPGNQKADARLLAKRWNKMRKALQLPNEYKLYSLKDSGALAIARNIESPIELKDQFRHSSLDTTSIYIRKAKPVANQNITQMEEDW